MQRVIWRLLSLLTSARTWQGAGSNLTNNHPLLTALVALAHSAEDKLYYARIWELETCGSLFNAQVERKPTGPILKENMRAKVYLQQRLQERVENL